MINFEVVLYPQKQSDWLLLDESMREFFSKNCAQWLIARHEPFSSEEYSNDLHFHYYGHLHCSWALEDLAKSLGVEPHQIQKIKKKWVTAVLYASHVNKPPKPLIPLECIETNISDYEALRNKALSGYMPSSTKVKSFPPAIRDYAENKISYSKLRSLLTFDEFNEHKRVIDNAKSYRVKKGIKRDMKVIYITGGAGSGKTTLAKFLGENLGYDVFVSGSGSDPLDGYDNEECIILDDLRADAFKKSELFKLLDNNTDSAVKSRYFNKVINNCKLMIITSIKPPHMLYEWSWEENEPFSQFARRLNYAYIEITDKGDIEELALCKMEAKRDTTVKPKSVGYDMKFVNDFLGISQRMPSGVLDIMRTAQNGAREALERRKKGN